MQISKVIFLVFLCLTALYVVNTQQVKSQDSEIVYILSDGSVFSSTNSTVPIQQDGNMYTFTGDIVVTSFVVERGNITIDGAGFSLAGEGERGIDLSFMNRVTVKNVQLIGSFYYGIYLMESSDITLTGNTITNNARGISLYLSTRNTISGNTLTNNQIGIELISSPDNVFRDNSLGNSYNFAVHGDELSHFINDVDVSNTINDKKVYYLVNKNNLVISPDTHQDVGFLAIVGCTNITVRNLELSNNGQGLVMAFTTGSTITQNTIINNNYNGILLFKSSGNIVTSNQITDSHRGIQFSNASNSNSVIANVVSNNTNGLFLFDSSENAISGNNITDSNTGIGFRASPNNRIFSNFFVNNKEQVYDYYMDDSSIAPSNNLWAIYPLGGNYWSDYTGVDLKSGSNQNQTGSDGIGDTPYSIYASNEDKYPLLPYGSPLGISIVSPENKTYTTTDVILDFTISEATSWIKYSLDGQANVTITGSTTLSGLAEGVHSITVYAQDTDELSGKSETIHFTISKGAEPTQSEAFPITWIVAIIGIAVVGVVLFYFLKIKKK